MPAHHLCYTELEAGLPEIRRSPRERGLLAMIVRRPRRGEREVLASGELDVEHGLVGDRWGARQAAAYQPAHADELEARCADRAEP